MATKNNCVLLRFSWYDHDILWNFAPGLFFWWGFWKKNQLRCFHFSKNSGRRIHTEESTRFNLKTPQGEAPLRRGSPSFVSQDHQAMQPIFRSNKNKKNPLILEISLIGSRESLPIFEGVWPPLPPTQKKSSICFAFYLFLKDFKVQLFLTLAKNNLNKLMIGIEIPSNLWCLITFQERPTPGSCVQMMMMMIHRTSALASSCCDFQHANAWGKSGEEVRNKTRQYGCFQK